MELVIKSKKIGSTFNFWLTSGGYVKVSFDGAEFQPCQGGRLIGETLTSTPENFETTARKWYRAFIRRW